MLVLNLLSYFFRANISVLELVSITYTPKVYSTLQIDLLIEPLFFLVRLHFVCVSVCVGWGGGEQLFSGSWKRKLFFE